MYCNNCGAELPKEAKFCHECGAKVAISNEVKQLEEMPDYDRTVDYTPKQYTKKCKVCDGEIPAEAKRCPLCGAKARIEHPFLTAFIILLFAFGFFFAFFIYQPGEIVQFVKDKFAETQQDETVDVTEAGIGDTATYKGVKATLLGVQEAGGIAPLLSPSDGKVFIYCTFDIENESDRDIVIGSLTSFDAFCDGYAVSGSLSSIANEIARSKSLQTLDGNVPKGKKIKGIISYEVPSNWQSLEIKFKPFALSRQGMTFYIEH